MTAVGYRRPAAPGDLGQSQAHQVPDARTWPAAEKRRRYVATTDSAHDLPIFADLTKGITLTAANQLWVADLTYVPIASGFAYVAIILDAWSRRVVGYPSVGRSTHALPLPRLKLPSRAGNQHRPSFIIPTVHRNTPPVPTEQSWQPMGLPDR
jgi:transposase InsO family protein